MKYFLTILMTVCLCSNAIAEAMRPDLVKASRDFLEKKTTPEDFLREARRQKSARTFSLEEKMYLQDLSQKMPESLRQKVCPTLDQGLCEGEFAKSTWEEVPVQKPIEDSPSEKSWLSRNSIWILAAAAGVVGVTAWSLRGKEIQFHSTR